MTRIGKFLSIVILLLGVGGVIIGAAFVGLGVAKNNELIAAASSEKVSMGIVSPELKDVIIDNMPKAQQAADTVRTHRHAIASSYQALLGSGKYDPTNPQHLTYAQAMNLENYLYLAVVAFGLTQVVTGTGAFMILTGLAIVTTGILFLRKEKV